HRPTITVDLVGKTIDALFLIKDTRHEFHDTGRILRVDLLLTYRQALCALLLIEVNQIQRNIEWACHLPHYACRVTNYVIHDVGTCVTRKLIDAEYLREILTIIERNHVLLTLIEIQGATNWQNLLVQRRIVPMRGNQIV